jgi:hypothetical protein
MRNIFKAEKFAAVVVGFAAVLMGVGPAQAVLYLYEPFNYTAGQSLGGSGGVPSGLSGTYVGGGSYTWYARNTGGAASHDPARDASISSGSLSYPGLATSGGNSVSYGSALVNQPFTPPDPEPANNAFNRSLYGDSVALPQEVTSGSLYASFIIRIKSSVEDGANAARHSPIGFVSDISPPNTLGAAMAAQTGTQRMGGFWMRRDPVDVGFTTTNFGVGKTSQDGIGPGQNATGHNAGWQNSDTSNPDITEDNQFGDVNGQFEPDFNNPNTWQTYFVVLKYEFDFANTSADDYDAPGSTPTTSDPAQLDTVSLWMNPGSGTLGVANGEILASQNPTGNLGSYYAATDAYTGTNQDMAAIRSFALFGHRLTTNNTFAVDLDELRIGTTWADVTPAATSAGQPGDHNGDGQVDAADYVAWRKTDGGNQDGYDDFFENFGEPGDAGGGGAVPEPSAAVLLLLGASPVVTRRR